MEGTEEKRQKLAEMMDKLAGEDIMVAFQEAWTAASC